MRRSLNLNETPQVFGEFARGLACVCRQSFVRFKLVHPGRHLIEAGQRVIDHQRRGAKPPRLDGRKHVLGGVHDEAHRRQIDHRGRPFQRVEHAENAIDALLRKSFPLRGDEIVIRLLEQFARLGDELFMERVHCGAPVSTATWRSRSGPDKGLTR